MQMLRVLLTLGWVVGSVAAAEKRNDKNKKVKARNMPKPPPRTILVASPEQLKETTLKKLDEQQSLNRREKKEIAEAELATYKDMRRQGYDEVSDTWEAVMLRNYRLRNKKRRGFFRKEPASLAAVLFPEIAPEEYDANEPITMYTDLVESKMTQEPIEFYDLPGYPRPPPSSDKWRQRMQRNLDVRLQGHAMKPAPFDLVVKQDMACQALCKVTLEDKELRWMRRLIERQYRVQLQLDGLPTLMRSKELNYAAQGYPLGFKAPVAQGQNVRVDDSDVFLYNHLKFAISYNEDPSAYDGVRITGFDVHPVSIEHSSTDGPLDDKSKVSTCQGFFVENDPANYLKLGFGDNTTVDVIFSYDVQWIRSMVEWPDRWDVYFVGAPDDDFHHYSIVNSLMIGLFMTGVIATIMIRTLRKDIAGYN